MKKNKRKELTPRQHEFIEAYERNAGDTFRICRELNISPSRCSLILSTPAVKEALSRNTQKAAEMIRAASPALARLAIDLALSPDTNPKIKVNLISDLLDRAGIIEKTPLV